MTETFVEEPLVEGVEDPMRREKQRLPQKGGQKPELAGRRYAY
jgi:hypothetical protein